MRAARSLILLTCFGMWGALACSALKEAGPDLGSDPESPSETDDGGTTSRRDAQTSTGDEDADTPGDVPAKPGCPRAADSPSPLKYVLNDATVFDTVTGLEWDRIYRRESEFETYAGAKAYCTALRTANHDDWRMPTLWEALSIVDYGQDDHKVSPRVFPGASALPGWTSTSPATSKKDTWIVNWDMGDYDMLSKHVDDAGKPEVPMWVRCVRAINPQCTQAAKRFVKSGSIVRDTMTGLEWEAGSGGAPRLAAEAVDYCNDLGGADRKRPWRVPSAKELVSILVFDRGPTNVVDPVFASQWDRWWTSTQSKYADAFDGRYLLLLPEGRMWLEFFQLDAPRAVRCVR